MEEPPFPALRRESETSSQAPASPDPDPSSSEEDEGAEDDEEDESLDESEVIVETLEEPRRVRQKVCLRPECGVTSPLEWRSGPDGRQTLCKNCSRRYSDGLYELWQNPESKQVSIVKRDGWRRVRVTGFLHRGKASKDLIRPVVEPVEEVEETVASKGEVVDRKDADMKDQETDAQVVRMKMEQDLTFYPRRKPRFSSRRLRSGVTAELLTPRGRKPKRKVVEMQESIKTTTPRRSKRLAVVGSVEQSMRSTGALEEQVSVDDTDSDAAMQEEAAIVPPPSAETSRPSGSVTREKSRRPHWASSLFETVVKAEYKGKAMAVTIPVGGTYKGFVGELRRVFELKRGFSIKYADDEGDLVTLGNKRDYNEMLVLIGKGDVEGIRVRVFDATRIRKVRTQE